MSSSLWSLTYNGTTQTLTAWGISDCQFHRFNLDTEFLSFAHTPANTYADPIFPYNAWLVLYRGDVVWFSGRVQTTPTFIGSAERQRYVVVNNWARVLRTIYQQQYVLKTEDFTGLIGSWSTRVVLGKDIWGRKITASAQISAIATYGSSVGTGLSIAASFGPFAYPPIETVRDISCAEAIRRMFAWSPDAVGSFNYTATGNTLSIVRRTSLTSVELDLDDEDSVELISGFAARHDLVPRGVVLIYQYPERDESDEEIRTQPFTREVRDTAGTTRGVGVLFGTIALGRMADGTPEAVINGLAAQYYAALSTVQYEGTLRLHERECSGLLRPGKRLNLANGQTAWATAAATIQATVEHLDTGVTEVSCGIGPFLGLGDFAGMMQRFRDRNEAGDFPGVQDNGTEGVGEQLPDTEPGGDPEEDPAGGEDTGPIGPPGGAPDVAEGDRVPNTGSNGFGGAGGGGGAGAASGSIGGGATGGRSVDIKGCNDAGQQVTVTVLAP